MTAGPFLPTMLAVFPRKTHVPAAKSEDQDDEKLAGLAASDITANKEETIVYENENIVSRWSRHAWCKV